MHNGLNIDFLVSSLAQQSGDLLQVRNCIKIARRLFGAESAVEITTYCSMASVSSKLANVINMVDQCIEGDYRVRGPTYFPSRIEHPCITSSSNHRIASNQAADLFIGELARAGNQRTAIVVTRENGTMKPLDGLPKTFIGQVGKVQDYTYVFHRF